MHVNFYEHNICINSSLNNKKRHEICRIAGVKKKAFFFPSLYSKLHIIRKSKTEIKRDNFVIVPRIQHSSSQM